MSLRRLAVLLFIVLVAAVPAFAQQPSDPNAQIVWPPSTYVLSGSFTIYGTANAPGMIGYYFEFRPLVDSVTPAGDEVGWNPASLPTRNPVVNGVLGAWDTTQIPDGLYELRLTIFTSSGQPIYTRVSPLRVMNTPSPFVPPALGATAFPTALPLPTQIPGATSPAANDSPEVIATSSVNVRAGDGTDFPAIGALSPGQHAPLLAVSTFSGWWQIRLPDGRLGWVAPSVVQVAGNFTSVPQITPPRPTATPTSIPTATPNPVSTAIPPDTSALPDASIANIRTQKTQTILYQGVPFTIIVTVVNNSAVALPAVSVACNYTPMNIFFSTTLSGLPPFGQTEVTIPAQLDSGGLQTVTANCAVDVNNLVAESNESNNFSSLSEWLET
jgi:uncharacterized protein YraI